MAMESLIKLEKTYLRHNEWFNSARFDGGNTLGLSTLVLSKPDKSLTEHLLSKWVLNPSSFMAVG